MPNENGGSREKVSDRLVPVWVALIGAAATIIAAWISSRPPTPPVVTPTSPPTCPTPPTYFRDVWENHPELGCPTSALTSDFTFQTFEGGYMIWQKSPSPSTIYGLYHDDERWERQTDPGGPPEPSCPEAEQTGGLGPIHSFGTLWCEPWNWKADLGQPLAREQDGGHHPVQSFEGGTVLEVESLGILILHSDSTWETF